MPWVTLPGDEATPELARMTKPYRDQGKPVPGIVAVLKATPNAFAPVLQLNTAVTFGGSGLGPRREELVATAVSAANRCYY